MRRNTRLLVATAMAAALLLAGCGSSSSSAPGTTPDPSASGGSTVTEWTGDGVPKVSGSFGDKPVITFSSAAAPETLSRAVLSEGKGTVVKKGDLLAVDYLGQVYGGNVFDNSFDRKEPSAFGIGAGKVIKGWDDTLIGVTAGSRVLIGVPPAQGYGPEGQPNAGIKGTDTLVFVVDIVRTYPGDVAGDPQGTKADPPPAGVTVGGELGKVPTVKVTDGTAKPAKATTTVLARGSGAPLADGLAVLQYVAVDWKNAPVESTWASGTPAGAPVKKGATAGVFDSLAGIPIGSRVVLTLPANSQGSGPFAVVVDIIDHVPTAKDSLTK